MNICFDGICDEFPLFSKVVSSSHWSFSQVSVFSIGKRYSDELPLSAKRYNISEFIPSNLSDEIDRITATYPDLSFSSLINADRFLKYLPEDAAKTHIVSAVKCFESAIEDGVDVFITTGTAYAYHLALLAVSEKHSVKSVSLYPARLPSARFYYSLGNGSVWEGLSASNVNMQTSHASALSNSDLVSDKPIYMQSVRQNGGLGLVFVVEFFRRLRIWIQNYRFRRFDYFTKHPLWYAKRDLARLLKKPVHRRLVSWGIAGDFDEFYLYPLHLQPEASTLVLGQFYEDEINNIINISKCLPGNFRLFVKEHPAAFGRRNLHFYRRIANTPNVTLIPPESDSNTLIESARAVITVSGTMGVEAVARGTCVFVLGDVFYDGFPGVQKVASWSCLKKELHKMKEREVGIAFDPKVVMHACSYEGLFDVCKLDTKKQVLDPRNVDKMAISLTAILDSLT